jgi:tight adherence protein C
MLGISFFIGQLLLFVAIVVIFYSAWDLLAIRFETLRRLENRVSKMAASSTASFGLSLDDKILKRYDKHFMPQDEETLNTLKRSLMRAGYRKSSDIRLFYASRLIGCGVALLAGIIILPLTMIESPLYITFSVLLLMMLMGFFAPVFWVERTHQYRKMQTRDGFPDALDLLLVCIEAGQGFDQALNRVVKELGTSNAVLADELNVVTREMRLGKDRFRVLADFADRSGVEDIKSFMTVIKQADKFGVSIAQALRVYSTEMRDKRYLRAEEKANMMPIKLALGAIVFTVPPAILVMVGPSVIMILQNLGGAM